ncbi:SGNH hydrolase-type esterase domain-containing protein [Ilyonectria robusta]|uniref:SGNH hydrolase-type esterase domain-containing protein n=1 Tax=Ilyonectria robusta TaxID=1079257 RepID=UPI001E8EA058|nr:SGNH hydrolase-type esterase domain-containing protein [Ilyonectria robusta]KAH8675222.1 SGNH hydrolase-type esterase domain-containing protein [Ilyonectria robusta]
MRVSSTRLLGVVCAFLSFSLPAHAQDVKKTDVSPGTAVKSGTELRILCVGDSITAGRRSGGSVNGGLGNGYRLQLRNDLSEDEVVFAGTDVAGNMTDGYYAAWPGKTIKYISDHVGPSLAQRPNIVLLHAGTNDMDDRSFLSTEGNDPKGAAKRLGSLIDQIIEACPDAVILVAMIIGTCDPHKVSATPKYQALIPGIVQERRSNGSYVLAVDFTTFPKSLLQDCIHPSLNGYLEFGHYWYDFITQIPSSWIKDPVGADPTREESAVNWVVQYFQSHVGNRANRGSDF